MRMAAILLVAALLSTSVMSGTFAKYVTSDSATDSARVAKFGVTVAMNGNLFGEAYDAGTDTGIIIARGATGAGTGTVQVDATGTNVVAPGTKSDKGLGFAVTGTPEVDVTVASTIKTKNVYLKAGNYAVMVAAEGVTELNFVANKYYTKSGTTYTRIADIAAFKASSAPYYKAADVVSVADDYYPVVYAMSAPSVFTSDVSEDSASLAAANIAKQLNGGTAVAATGAGVEKTYTITGKTYKANTDLSTAIALSGNTISWAWDFEDTYDKEDTILGNLQAGLAVVKTEDSGATYAAPVAGTASLENDYNLTTSFDMSISVTQID